MEVSTNAALQQVRRATPTTAAALVGVVLGQSSPGFLVKTDCGLVKFSSQETVGQLWYRDLPSDDREQVDAWMATWARKSCAYGGVH